MSQLLLVRHGQASFGAADYDQLSALGEEQARVLGAALAARGVEPTVVVAGEMKRHAQTATALLEGAGRDASVTVDAGWNEFDHLQVLEVHGPPEADETVDEKAAFQRWFEQATLRWTGGEHDDEYEESFGAFASRVEASLARLAADLPEGGTAVVLTSGGPIAWAAASLLADDPALRTSLWLRLNPVSVNTGLSKVVVGSRGTTLVSFNDHGHLSPDLLTYR